MPKIDKTITQQQSLIKAKSGVSMANYPEIFRGFAEKGIPEDQVFPRENVFTYNAWKALNRQVRKGESGVKIVTWVETVKKDDAGNLKPSKFPKSVTVFHISQTDEVK